MRLLSLSIAVTVAIAVLLAAALPAGVAAKPLPEGWFPAGTHPNEYDMDVDTSVKHSGEASGHIKSKVDTPSGFGTLMQSFLAEDYRNKRIQLTAWAKTQDVQTWAGVWMRVDGSNGRILAFDNMSNRPITGTTDWKQYELVLDIPEEGALISFGVLVTGKGEAWIDDITFKEVDEEVAVTDLTKQPSSGPKRPQNLNFE
jgi:hypothetical protein